MRLWNLSHRSRLRSRTLAALCSTALIAAIAAAPAPAAAAEVVLSNDFESGSYAPWGPRGDVTLAITDEGHESDNSLSVTGRTANWQGPATSATALFETGTPYSVTAWVKLPAGTEGTAGVHFTVEATPADGGDNTYTWIGGNVPTTADGWVQIGGDYTLPAGLSAATLYVEAEGSTPFLLDDVLITAPDGGGGGPEPGTVVIDTDFEDGLDGWGPRDGGPGAPSVALTDVAHGGVSAALVTDRVNQGAGLGRDVTGLFEAGVSYEFSAWLRFAEGQPSDQIWLSLASTTGDSQSFSTLAQFETVTNTGWTEVTARFTMPAADSAFLYFETRWQGADVPGNTSDFLADDIVVRVPEPPVIEDLTGIHETTDFPVGVAIDSRETVGGAAELLTRHFNQITPENHMKPEAWYDDEGNFRPHEQALAMMDFARDNDLRVYGHVLVWHSQTPAWFFQDSSGEPLTTSAADQQLLRDRLRTHIFDVAESLSERYGPFGSATNPLYAFDAVNEVVSDSGEYADGLRRSEWYRILGETFIDLTFEYADEAFNDVHAVEGSDPVTLFINDYNTEQSGKQARYRALVDRLLARGVPVHGVGHQFHVSLAMPVSSLETALETFAELPVTQAVTELDVTTGTPVSQANLIEQGYYYRDAFRIFRAYSDDLLAVTVWGLTDGRSWRSGNGAPLLFDDNLRAKPAYYGAVDGELPARLRTANVFAGDVPLTDDAPTDLTWRKLPLHPVEETARFQLRWAPDHLTAYVTVTDATVSDDDRVSFVVGDETYQVSRDGTGDVPAVAAQRDGGYHLVAHLPLTGAAQGDTLTLDVRVSDNGVTSGWNTPGALGTLTLVEELSYLEVRQVATGPVIDGTVDGVWAQAGAVTTDKEVSGTDGATAKVRTLWRDQTLYVLAEVTDPVVDVSGSDPWTQDSVEIYVDAGNAKNGSYRYDDTQIRISADNVVSFGTGDEAFQAGRLASAVVRTDTGYTVEAAISLLEYGGLDTFHGLDFQVNDASDGARTAIRNWAEPNGVGYQTTARWGVGRLVAGSNVEVVLTRIARWNSDSGGGYCATITATNNSDKAVKWSAVVDLEGDIYNAWNFERKRLSDGSYRISGVDWNRTLAAGASTFSIGYCANL
ncbi:endo-1,4-beta-xylanase [Micromonospora phaseoli]|uniref:Beta-xylanase n=1 Tax=Micromonospora phaseoli TaxID=1144548 RepID=A0A1H6S5N1_9ACTN|nr:endo-1,4-beta-xylanase [Micromonospora phaseoli]PZW03812.1 endo-1,4-beta-xylanase [Micromonospora phaseoli]GIJ79114.1 endo-1,4-beta-xylanase A [Micromonospora phaseoli]SEI63199.1 endo-1,4-beta-xylanase [Micromonospora phaseoli]